MDDLISRQAVLNLLHALPPEEVTTKALLIQGVKQMDAAQPERKKGEWIETEFLKLRECSCCHVRWGMYDVENFDFCPNCGADMRGEQDG